MMPKEMLHITETLFIIPLKDFSLEQIVEKKLNYYLENHLPVKDIFTNFYDPIEKAVIEVCLDLFRGNQLRVAQFLEINRNTLKKKINLHGIVIKNLLRKDFASPSLKQDVYVSQITQLGLLEISRLKLDLLKDQILVGKNPLKSICEPVEQAIIKSALSFFKNNQLRTALFLEVSRNTLKKRLNYYSSLSAK